ncbi:MAG: acyl-CoA dehydrogenase family protein [Acidimicrobiia bacterium]
MIDREEFRRRCCEFFARPIPNLGEQWATGFEFQRLLHGAGLAGVTVPAEYGGLGLPSDYVEILNDEARGLDLPVGVLVITIGMCVPVL